MSQPKSRLIPGLIVGFFAMLLTAAGAAAVYVFQDRLPATVVHYGDGVPLVVALAVLTGLVVGLAVRAVRPRSRVLPLFAALYGGAAVVGGVVVGFAPRSRATTLPLPLDAKPVVPPLPTVADVIGGLDESVGIFWPPDDEFWKPYTIVALGAVVAFLLVALRVRKVRHATLASQPPVQDEEQEYRAPFEPAQPADTTRPPADLFAPTDTARSADPFTPVEAPRPADPFTPVEAPRPADPFTAVEAPRPGLTPPAPESHGPGDLFTPRNP
ncbi:hypothetical protein ACIBG8_00205 [Nonomuraea sp. NPDC050556]|uniref:hypothetical protein n=1 Tax=Nonomuraea sp. NPDC050556 TaxID=3364369 RepID=UPI0037B0CB46